ncbi:phage integrase family protein [Tamaricihabitans halophyticus]|uniref:Phage integrase family protein n=1 Tax=Tamaricihabitans halophyticus TaxID=1262583 RepID=A0A4R2QV60_9PSEU|nr:site-specific integrase [Tamaricihabitans halophyticus]TCP50921.1 phage integrase family protein [Tamaricihabitans halophyticus]
MTAQHDNSREPAVPDAPTSIVNTSGERPLSPHDRLAALDSVAAAYVAEQRPANTRKAYADAWRIWQDYTRDAGIPVLSSTVGALVGFVRWLETTKAASVATIDARLTGAVVGLRGYGIPVDQEASRAAWNALKGYERRLAEAGIVRGRGKAQPVTLAHLRAMSRACPSSVAGLRDRAVLLLGFTIAARRSELAGLRVTDLVSAGSDGLLARLGYTKTGPDERAVPYGVHRDTCPVSAWHAWRQAAGMTEGPAFRRVDRHDHVFAAGLSAQAIGEVIARCGKRAELPFRITGHSLRAGLATEARRNGADHKAVCDQGGWSYGSKAVHGYFHTVDRWSDNAVRDIGL